jgi:hypothetical protein
MLVAGLAILFMMMALSNQGRAAMGHTGPKTLVIFCAERAHRKKGGVSQRF